MKNFKIMVADSAYQKKDLMCWAVLTNAFSLVYLITPATWTTDKQIKVPHKTLIGLQRRGVDVTDCQFAVELDKVDPADNINQYQIEYNYVDLVEGIERNSRKLQVCRTCLAITENNSAWIMDEAAEACQQVLYYTVQMDAIRHFNNRCDDVAAINKLIQLMIKLKTVMDSTSAQVCNLLLQ